MLSDLKQSVGLCQPSDNTHNTYSKSRNGFTEANEKADLFQSPALAASLIHYQLFVVAPPAAHTQLPIIPYDTNLMAHF